jgi:hypothetical protein
MTSRMRTGSSTCFIMSLRAYAVGLLPGQHRQMIPARIHRW